MSKELLIGKYILISWFIMIFIILNYKNKYLYAQELLKKPWFKHALEYISADERMIKNLKLGKTTFDKDYRERHDAEIKVFLSPTPSESELLNLLNSNDNIKIKVVLVNIMIKKLKYDKIFLNMIENYKSNYDYMTRFYIYNCFHILDKKLLLKYEDGILNIISKEKDESLIINSLPILLNYDINKTIQLFIKYLEKGSHELKLASYLYLSKMEKPYLDNVKKRLEKRNSIQALKFIKEVESGRKP